MNLRIFYTSVTMENVLNALLFRSLSVDIPQFGHCAMAEHDEIEKRHEYDGFDENIDVGHNEKTEVDLEDVPAAVSTSDVEVQSVHGLKRELKSRHLQMSKLLVFQNFVCLAGDLERLAIQCTKFDLPFRTNRWP